MKAAFRGLLLLLLLGAPVRLQAQWSLAVNPDDTNTATIDAYGGPDVNLTIPTNITGLLVTGIGHFAFGSELLRSVTIPAAVTNIEPLAFYPCSNLKEILVDPQNSSYSSVGGVLFDKSQSMLLECPVGIKGAYNVPASVTVIGEDAFEGSSLTNVTISTHVVDIEREAFGASSLTSITIPGNVTNIGDFAFDFCDSLTNIVLSSGVTGIGLQAFAYCTGLTSVTLPASLSNIVGQTFAYCSKLTSISVDAESPFFSSTNGVLFNKTFSTLVECPNGLAGSYAIPDGVTDIANGAFYNCTNLTTITIPPSVVTIEDYAFYSCSKLTNITIPTGVTSIGSQGFAFCTGLKNVTVPGSVTNLGLGVFVGCTGLTNVILSDGVTGIGGFPGCTNLTSIEIPNSVTSIDSFGFQGSGVATVMIGDSVTNIGDSAFASCPKLTSITIPASVVNIGENVFSSCSNLTAIAVDKANSFYSSANGVLFDKNVATLLEYPEGLAGTYMVPQGVTSISSMAFQFCSNLTSITMPDSVSTIGQLAFNDCARLTNANLGSGIVNIGYQAFKNSGLRKIIIPGGVTNFPFAFLNCFSLTNVTIENGVTGIPQSAFSECYGLRSVTIPASVTNISIYAFSACQLLQNIFFAGNAPTAASFSFGNTTVGDDPFATAYYLPGTFGWTSTFAGLPTAYWTLPTPLILSNGSSPGLQDAGFGFTISWATNASVVIEASGQLDNPLWVPLQTNTVTNGVCNFNDPQWTNYPARFYRIKSQ